jgi:hypothetical protein
LSFLRAIAKRIVAAAHDLLRVVGDEVVVAYSPLDALEGLVANPVAHVVLGDVNEDYYVRDAFDGFPENFAILGMFRDVSEESLVRNAFIFTTGPVPCYLPGSCASTELWVAAGNPSA